MAIGETFSVAGMSRPGGLQLLQFVRPHEYTLMPAIFYSVSIISVLKRALWAKESAKVLE
jgi:hypothetical protein